MRENRPIHRPVQLSYRDEFHKFRKLGFAAFDVVTSVNRRLDVPLIVAADGVLPFEDSTYEACLEDIYWRDVFCSGPLPPQHTRVRAIDNEEGFDSFAWETSTTMRNLIWKTGMAFIGDVDQGAYRENARTNARLYKELCEVEGHMERGFEEEHFGMTVAPRLKELVNRDSHSALGVIRVSTSMDPAIPLDWCNSLSAVSNVLNGLLVKSANLTDTEIWFALHLTSHAIEALPPAEKISCANLLAEMEPRIVQSVHERFQQGSITEVNERYLIAKFQELKLLLS